MVTLTRAEYYRLRILIYLNMDGDDEETLRNAKSVMKLLEKEGVIKLKRKKR